MKFVLELFIIVCLKHLGTLGSKIIFPAIDDFPTECKLPDGSKGICRNLQYCPAAITAKKVKSCYFEGNEEYVCCKENVWDDIKTRPFFDGCGDQEPYYEVVNGLMTEYKEFPYMVALGWQNLAYPNQYDYKCGGVLISRRYVLTAAHCALQNGLPPLVALIGGNKLSDNSTKPKPISEVITHLGYKANKSYHDIALVKLEHDANEPSICIWGSYSLSDVNVTAIGYGHTRFGGAGSDSLLKAYLLVVSNKDCSTYYKGEDLLPDGIVETQICAKDPTSFRDTCQGDSGGPLILSSADKYGIVRQYIVGITSFGKACALEPPGIYTRVSEYIDWIEKIVFTNQQ